MAALLQSLRISSPLPPSSSSHLHRSFQGYLGRAAVHSSSASSFNGRSLSLQLVSLCKDRRIRKSVALRVTMVKPTIQFIQGIDEQTVPDVRLTKSRDGTNGMAIFNFSEPSVFDSSSVLGDITGFYMIDDEGTLQSVDVSAKYVNGKPAGIEAKYIMRNTRDWDRFMRFMERWED